MGEVKNFFYYLFHYKKIMKELKSLRERDKENQLLVANYSDKINRLEKENCCLGKYNDVLEKECNEMFKHKDEKIIMSIHIPKDYGEKIHEFTNYGNVKIHDRIKYWPSSDLDKILDELKDE